MFILHPLLLILSLAPLLALAGHSLQHDMLPRSRKHHRQTRRNSGFNRTLTERQLTSSSGPMVLKDIYSGQSFFDGWNFFTDPDPTHGNVQYVSQEVATSSKLAYVGDDNVAVIAVDSTTPVSVGGNRQSVRITSNSSYNEGLFVLSANQVPTGCGTWPAFWTTGPNWPNNGEIDIVEGVNLQKNNQMTLHTAPGCTLDTSAAPMPPNTQAYLGTVIGTDCDATANSNSGCGVTDPDSDSFGAGVGQSGGAVYAMLWDSIGIRIWHFDTSNTPPDLSAGAPTPATWPVPSAFWSTVTCPVTQYFHEHNIIINTSLCGDWAGSAYASSGCPATCAEQVADPSNFADAQWKINYVAVYQ